MCTGYSLDGVLLVNLFSTWNHFFVVVVLVTNH